MTPSASLRRLTRSLAAAGLLGSVVCASAQSGGLPPLDDSSGWHIALLPKQKPPPTRLQIVPDDGASVLRIESNASYGHWVHRLASPQAVAGQLSWRWRVDRFVASADLRQRAGDDASVKLCVMFDMPLDDVSFVERQKLRLARLAMGEALPAATLCYVWDTRLPADTVLPNAYTDRMRWLVLRGPESAAGQWRTERRDLRADFLRVFGARPDGPASMLAVLVGADADNTGGEALAFVADLRWHRP